MNEERHRNLAVAMAVLCVRNTSIEDVHAGIEPHSPSGDYSDVKVVTPVGEIPWPRMSCIRDDEMRAFMKQVVELVLKEITDCFERGETVMLSSFGSFVARKKGQSM